MDTVMDFIKKNYVDGEPVFTSDIQILDVSGDSIRQQLKRLTDAGKLIRYDMGIYYMPKESRLKNGFRPSADVVVRYKYISRRGKVDGYYTGYTFANQLGISSQVPYKPEIVSNNVSAIVRNVEIGGRSFLIRKAKVPVTNENYKILQLLEFLKDLDSCADEDEGTVRECLTRYVRQYQISHRDMDCYINYFPVRIYKSIYKMRLDHVLA